MVAFPLPKLSDEISVLQSLALDLRWTWSHEEGYRSIQSTKPMTLAFALMDSPAGLAGWLAEGSALLKAGEKVTVPTAYSEYPMDTLPVTPRSWAERSYNIKRWRVMDKGGHFAAMEEPELFADDVRDAFAEML